LVEGQRFYLSRHHFPEALVRTFEVGDDGICSICKAYAASYRPAGIAQDLARFRTACETTGAVLGLSGGKDSLSALYLAHEVLGVRVYPVLFDNGYIPQPVIDQARAVCERLSLPLEVRTHVGAGQATFRELVTGATVHAPPPCDACARSAWVAFDDVAAERGTSWVIFGTNYYAAWASRPYAASQRLNAAGRVMFHIHLPYALGVTRTRTLANVRSLGATPAKMPGVSTNCQVPAIVQRRLGAVLGHVPEREDLSIEVLVGHLTRDDALADLDESRDIPS
jgi:PP-loop superfamily ATP-utilizing enzyme